MATAHPAPSSDYAWYFRAATRLAEGAGYIGTDNEPTAYWPVGWPFALSALFRLTGPSVTAGLILQVVLSTLTAVLLVLLVHRATGHLPAAVASGAVYTLMPSGWAWDSQLGSEQLFTLLTLGLLYLVLRADRWPWFLAAGVVGGLACLVRPVLLAFPAALLLIELLRRRGWRPALAHAGAFSVAMAVTIAPWTVRNAVVLGSPVPVSTNGGVNLYQGTRTSTGYWWSSNPAVNPLVRTTDEVERDDLGTRLALKRWWNRPDDFARRVPQRMRALYSGNNTPFWWLYRFDGWSEAKYRNWRTVADIVYALVMAVAAVGAWVAWRVRRDLIWVLGGFVVYYTALWTFFPTWDRFRFPLMPVFAVFAGVAVMLRDADPRRPPATGGSVTAARLS